MIIGWVILAITYLAGLFWLARWGDSHSPLAKKITSHPAIYSLALAIYCTAWTFFGSVGEASRNSWSYLPILLGPMLLYLFGYRFLYKFAKISKKQHINTIADFISSRYGKRQVVALVVTTIALLATIPYIALQLKAIGSAFLLISGQTNTSAVVLGATVFIALFSIYFGTKGTDVTEYRRGLILAISFESVFKLIALIIVAILGYVWWQQDQQEAILTSFVTAEALGNLFSFPFWAQTFMAAAAVVCLPRQFHVAVVDNLDLAHLKTARWLFPLYLAMIALVIPVIAAAGHGLLGNTSSEPDTYVLALAILSDSLLLKMLVFLGGLSAATAMIVVATLTLSTMLTNDVILPTLLTNRAEKQHASDYTKTILFIRRAAIACLLLLSYLYQRQMAGSHSLASIGLIAFSLVIQLVPAIVGGLYWKRGHAHGVYAGLIAGVGTWMLWLILPLMGNDNILILENSYISEGALLSLLLNSLAYFIFSLSAEVRLIDRIQAEAFVNAADERNEDLSKLALSTTVGDLKTLLSTFLGENRCQLLLEDYQRQHQVDLNLDQKLHKTFVIFCERALGGVIGASSAKALIDSVVSGKQMNFEEVVNFFGDTTEAIKFNISILFASLESLEQGISVIDKDLKLIAWNRSYIEFFNYPPEMINVGTPIETLIRYNAMRGECGVGDIETLVQKRLRHLRVGSRHRFLRERSDGKKIEMVGSPLPDGGFVTSFNDVTQHIEIQDALTEANIDLENRIQIRSDEVHTINAELHREILRRADAEKEIVSAQQLAEQANASKTRFLALASHDILQPLNAAKLYLGALQEIELNPAANNIVNKLGESLNSSEILIDTLLDIARLDQGDMLPRIETVSMTALLTSLIDEFKLTADDKQIGFKTFLSDVWVSTDPTYLYRIVQNMLSNAFKYTQQGKVLLAVRQRNAGVLIQVWDTGRGISEHEQAKIFSDFYRVRDHQEQGVGLGLSVVSRLSEQLNAPLELRSVLGKGSCFSVTVPDAPAQQERRHVPITTTSALQFNGLKVLVVDDKQENIDAMRVLLSGWSVDFYSARSSQEAIEIAHQCIPDIVLMDYHLQEPINGLQLIESIRSYIEFPVASILLTANKDPDIEQRCMERQCGYLTKPVKAAKLRALMKAVQVEVEQQ